MTDRVTMYRLLMYYLIVLICAALFFGAIGIMPYNPYSIVISVMLAVGTCFGLNYVFAKIYKAPTNWESAILTGLILSLVISPALSVKDVPFILAASGLAIASKYMLAVHNKHIFNPVAIAIVLTALGPQESANWWVGSVWLLPFVVIGGFLIAYKIRRLRMVFMFFGVALVSTVISSFISGQQFMTTITAIFLHSSLFFLGFVMLTEPATSPTARVRRYVYATIVGFLFAPALHIGSVYSTPELALVIGNLVAFFMTPIVKTKVKKVASTMFGERTQDFAFIPERSFNYQPGQYIEMTLPHSRADARGLKRYFTLASSPTEPELHLGVRYYTEGSTFKRALRDSASSDMAFGQLGGDFVMPSDTSKKLAFIAGGIGVTPFRSMVKYLSDANEVRDVVLLYAERTSSDIAYYDIFEEARQRIGVRTVYLLEENVLTANSLQGRISKDTISETISDYKERVFYISGPQLMVRGVKRQLKELGVPSANINVDYFSGYA